MNQAKAGQRQASAGLVAYLDLPPNATIEPQEDRLRALPSVQAAAGRMVADALRRRPELAALAEGAQAFDSLAAAEQAGDLPDVFQLAFATGAYTPGRDLVESRYITDPLYHFDPGVLAACDHCQAAGITLAGRSPT